MDSVALYQENKCDSFISIGGGSSHDACKGARVSVAHDGRNVNEFEDFGQVRGGPSAGTMRDRSRSRVRMVIAAAAAKVATDIRSTGAPMPNAAAATP
jgi:Iron-containing alcohol dehydrogenase